MGHDRCVLDGRHRISHHLPAENGSRRCGILSYSAPRSDYTQSDRATPFSPESIRALGTVIASCSRRDIFHAMSIQPPQCKILRIIVEVARNDNMCLGRKPINRIHRCSQIIGYQKAMCLVAPSPPARLGAWITKTCSVSPLIICPQTYSRSRVGRISPCVLIRME